MKDLLRLRTSLKEEIEKALNEQVKQEGASSALYLSMAGWCERKGFEKSAEFFYDQSEEERGHMLKLFRYINEVGGKAVTPPVGEVVQEFDSFRSVFEMALEQEINITDSVNRLVDKCYKAKDYSTVNFLEWFVEEQREEEAIARRCIELFDIIGEEGVGRFTIDQEIGEIKTPKEV
ncbi:ferritin [Xanthovirga aplysinae]|uniref:ferritin n=1 Tax=Xanthovirga aplysinae TaxID=2529853 RepID=UPI0012BCD70C|nr:ferritin [Xanthovirga aplysinae]MTI33036.1 ferritin [Xanthovirga aplysinae]